MKKLLFLLLAILILVGCQGTKQTSEQYTLKKIYEGKFTDGKVIAISPEKIIIEGKTGKSVFPIDGKTEIVELVIYNNKSRKYNRILIGDIKTDDRVTILYDNQGKTNKIQKETYEGKLPHEKPQITSAPRPRPVPSPPTQRVSPPSRPVPESIRNTNRQSADSGQESSSKAAKQSSEEVGIIRIETTSANCDILLVDCRTSIDHGKDSREKLRDCLLEASPIEKGKELKLKPGNYVLAVRRFLPRNSQVLHDLGGKAPNNSLVAPSKVDMFEFIVGGGISAGALFKAVKDVYLTYGGALFAEGSGTPNKENIAKYNYLKSQGTKELIFLFVKGMPDFELWLLQEVNIKPGILVKQQLKIPGD